nr:MAG TPA: hypothetical protein [Caudoviricetes sp.]
MARKPETAKPIFPDIEKDWFFLMRVKSRLSSLKR